MNYANINFLSTKEISNIRARLLTIIDICEVGRTLNSKRKNPGNRYIDSWINGNRDVKPTLETLYYVALEYCINFNWLLLGEDSLYVYDESK